MKTSGMVGYPILSWLYPHTEELKVYKSLEADRGWRPQNIVNSCCFCLQTLLKKERLKCNLADDA